MLDIMMLGTPEIRWHGKLVTILRRIPRTMLFYLATFSQPVARGTMLATFWPEMGEKSARDAFRDNLAKLRKALPDPSIIQADNFTICLDFNQVRVDYLDFLKLVQLIGHHPWQIADDLPLSETMSQQMEMAVGLWRSPRLLTGMPLPNASGLDEWLSTTEQSIYHKRDRIYNRLAHHCMVTGDFERSIHWIDTALEADPVNEELHLMKLESLAGSGHRSEAIKYGKFVKDLYSGEYNEQPSNQFLSCLQRIILEQEQKDLTRKKVLGAGQKFEVPFIGMRNALQLMVNAFEKGKVILVEGDIGAGKTRLVNEFWKKRTSPPRMLVASCHPSTKGIPFQPLTEMIRTGIHPEELASLDSYDISCLSQLDPSFRVSKMSSNLGIGMPLLENQSRIYEAIYHLCRLISKKQRLIIFVDDIHYGDDATISTLWLMTKNQFLLTGASLVMTREKGRKNLELDRFINDLTQQKNIYRIELDPLNRYEISELASHVIESTVDEAVIDRIEQEIGGNPLLIIEMLGANPKAWVSSQEEWQADRIPGSIRALLREKYLSLTPTMQTLVSLVALSGPFSHYETIEIASQQTSEEVMLALDGLEKQDILISSTNQLHAGLVYQFRQRLFQEAVLMEMSAARKRLLHRRIAAALKISSTEHYESLAAILATHYEGGGNLEEAFSCWSLSADYARNLGSPGDSYLFNQKAEAILPVIENQLSNETITAFYNTWSETAYHIQDTSQMERIYQKVMDLGEKRQSALLLGTALHIQSNRQFALNQYSEGLAIIEQALRYLKECGCLAEWLFCMARKAKFLYMLARFDEACTVIESALQTTPNIVNESIQKAQALLHYDYATTLILMGYPVKSVEQAKKSLQYYMQSHNVEGQAKVYGILVLANGYCGETIQAETEGVLGIQLTERIKYIRMLGYIHSYMGMVKVCRGMMDDAWSHAIKAVEIGKKYNYPDVLGVGLRVLGDIYRFLDNREKAVEYYQMAYDSCADSFLKYDSLSRLGFMKCVTGHRDSGNRMITEALNAAERMSFGSVVLSSKLYMLMISKNHKILEDSKLEIQQILDESEARGLIAQWGVALGLLARLDYIHHRPVDATEKINRILEKGRQFEGLWASLLLQIFHDEQISVQSIQNPYWKSVLIEFIQTMESKCHLPELEDSYHQFAQSIDNIA